MTSNNSPDDLEKIAEAYEGVEDYCAECGLDCDLQGEEDVAWDKVIEEGPPDECPYKRDVAESIKRLGGIGENLAKQMSGPIKQLGELGEGFSKQMHELSIPEVRSPKYVMKENEGSKKVKAFVSYSTSDKELAGKIKKALENYGLEVFLAHEDISPSREWRKEILQNIESSDIFIPVLTENFKESTWTDQESGMAIFTKSTIIPLNVDKNPHGFLKDYQAFSLDRERITKTDEEGGADFNYEDVEAGCRKMVKSMLEDKILSSLLKDCLIESFVESSSFKDAGKKSDLLALFDSWTQKQVRKIIRGSIQNEQIHQSYYTKSFLKQFIEENSEAIEPENRKKLLELLDGQ